MIFPNQGCVLSNYYGELVDLSWYRVLVLILFAVHELYQEAMGTQIVWLNHEYTDSLAEP
jgi:hypothetical protein